MRTIMNVTLPHEPFNTAIRDGTASAKIDRIMAAIKPEAAYFTVHTGKRHAVLIVNMPDPSKMPALAEPFFLTFNADVTFHPVMTPDDLKKAGLDEIAKQWG